MVRRTRRERKVDKKRSLTVVLVCCIVILLVILSGCSSSRKQGKSSQEKEKSPQTEGSEEGGTKTATRAHERIAFIKDGDVWTMKPDGSDKKQLTNTPNYEFSLSFSETAKRIWFVKTTATKWEELPTGEVWNMKIDGTDAKRITAGQMKVRFATVCPNGRKIGISIVKAIPETKPGGQAGDTADLWIMDANTPDQTEASKHVALSDDLAASPDMGREGSTFCAWSPDSKKIVFTFKADESASLGISTRQIYIANKDGSDKKKIGGGMDHPAFSPNGKYIAAEQGMHWDTIGLKAITTSGEDYKEIVPIPTGDLYSVSKPVWIVDTKVAYTLTTHPAQPAESTTTLYSSDLGTLDKTAIVAQEKLKGTVKNLAVSFSEKKIVFDVEYFYAQGGEKTYYIWIVNADGGDPTKITTGPEDMGPIWIKE